MPFAFIAGVDGFALFAPYLLLLVTVHLVRRRIVLPELSTGRDNGLFRPFWRAPVLPGGRLRPAHLTTCGARPAPR